MRATQADVARVAGVSRQLVSLVVNDSPHVAPETRQRVLDAISQVGYIPNATARHLATAKSTMIGVLVPDFVNPFYGIVSQEIRTECEKFGLQAYLASVGTGTEIATIENFLSFPVGGLILVAPLLSNEVLEPLVRQVPTVILTRSHGPATCDLVRTDDEEGEFLATADMIDHAYSPIVFLSVDRGIDEDTMMSRRRGYERAMRERGLDPLCEVAGDHPSTIVNRLLDTYGSGLGIAVHNDFLAFTVASELTTRGYTVGRDIGITGFDNTFMSQFPGAGVTSVDPDAPLMARATIELLRERMSGCTKRTEVVTQPRLLRRASTTR